MAKKTTGKSKAKAAKPNIKPKRMTKPAKTTAKKAQEQKLAAKWVALHEKAKAIPTQKYNMKNEFEKLTGIDHKVLGWGFVLENTNDRLEVLFKDGIRFLISNYR